MSAIRYPANATHITVDELVQTVIDDYPNRVSDSGYVSAIPDIIRHVIVTHVKDTDRRHAIGYVTGLWRRSRHDGETFTDFVAWLRSTDRRVQLKTAYIRPYPVHFRYGVVPTGYDCPYNPGESCAGSCCR